MVRSKSKLAYMKDDSARKTSYKKRNLGLFKKVTEIRALCDVDACSIVYGPYDPKPTICPSDPNEVRRIIERFRGMPDYHRVKKMMNQETFTMDRIMKLEEKLSRLRKDNHAKELTQLMFNWINGVGTSNLAPSQLKEISSMAEKKIEEINRRISALTIEQNPNVGDTKMMHGSVVGDITPQPLETMPGSGGSFFDATRVSLGPMDPSMNRASEMAGMTMIPTPRVQEDVNPPFTFHQQGFQSGDAMMPFQNSYKGDSQGPSSSNK